MSFRINGTRATAFALAQGLLPGQRHKADVTIQTET